MKERPIIFTSDSVRAILDGRKTQTRRVINPQPTAVRESPFVNSGIEDIHGWEIQLKYGQPGDRLWVKETWRKTFDIDDKDVMEYRAGGTRLIVGNSIQHGGHRITSVLPNWCPSIFMPRWASRITLEIVTVRVERVQDISEADAEAEGIHLLGLPEIERYNHPRKHKVAYEALWNEINAKRGYGWDVNPWVWVIEFKRIESPQPIFAKGDK